MITMKTFVATILAVLLLTFFAASNKTVIPVTIASYSTNVPLSLALIFPIGIALLLFTLFHLRIMRKAALVIRDLEDNVEEMQKQLITMTKRAHELEIENRKLKIRFGEPEDEDDGSL